MGRIAIAALALFLSVCGVLETSVDPAHRRTTAPAEVTPPSPCHLAPSFARFEGRAPALAPGALVVHGDGTTSLHRIDERGESSATFELARPVHALANVEDGFVVLSIAEEPSVAQLDADGREQQRIALAGTATGGALTVDEDVAWIALRDADDAIAVHRVDLLEHRAEDPVAIGSGRGRLLVTRELITWRAEDAVIWSPDGAVEAPGAPHALVGGTVIYEARDRTGLWVGDEPPVRVTPARVHPSFSLAAPLRLGFVLAYRGRGELWIQASHPTEGPIGEPMLVAPDASPVALSTRGARFWVAWERDGAVEVRGGYCALED